MVKPTYLGQFDNAAKVQLLNGSRVLLREVANQATRRLIPAWSRVHKDLIICVERVPFPRMGANVLFAQEERGHRTSKSQHGSNFDPPIRHLDDFLRVAHEQHPIRSRDRRRPS